MNKADISSRRTSRLRLGVALVALMMVAAIVCFLTAVPASQRKEGVIGFASALLVLAIGFTTIYRIGKAAEHEEEEEEHLQHPGSAPGETSDSVKPNETHENSGE